MKVVESPPTEERMALIATVADDAANLLGVDNTSDSPQSIVAKANGVMVDIVFGKKAPISQDEDPDLLLGALLGDTNDSTVQLVLGRCCY